MIRVLMLGTYPIKKPYHGGQIRVSEILKSLRKQNIEAEYVSVCYERAYKKDELTKNDIPLGLGVDSRGYYDDNPFFLDLQTGYYSVHNIRIWNELNTKVQKFKPDYIQIEQMYMYPFYAAIKEKYPEIKLVYSSHNVEYLLKSMILQQYKVSKYDEAINHIKEQEVAAIKDSSFVIAVSDSDIDFIKQYRTTNIYHIKNGISKKEFTETNVNKWRKQIGNSFALYVGSAHPPNLIGFKDLMLPLTYLTPSQKVIVVGGVGDMITSEIWNNRDSDIYTHVNSDRFINLGRLDESDLAAVIQLARVIVLPLNYGSGSNLKTAEALLSGKYIVATSKSMVGYEDFIGTEGLFLSDSNEVFRRNVQKCLSNTDLIISDKELERRNVVLWDNILMGIGDLYYKTKIEQY